MKLIAFTGKMGSGKSTAIEELRKLVNYQTANVKFAQPLYDIQEFVYSASQASIPAQSHLLKTARSSSG